MNEYPELTGLLFRTEGGQISYYEIQVYDNSSYQEFVAILQAELNSGSTLLEAEFS